MFKIDFRIDYADTDAMGIVHHGAYLRYFERCRVEWLRSLGRDYRSLEAEGLGMPLIRAELEYKKPCYFDDTCELRLGFTEMGKTWLEFNYSLYVGSDLTTLGSTRHVLCRRSNIEGRAHWKLERIPLEWRALWPKPAAPK